MAVNLPLMINDNGRLICSGKTALRLCKMPMWHIGDGVILIK